MVVMVGVVVSAFQKFSQIFGRNYFQVYATPRKT